MLDLTPTFDVLYLCQQVYIKTHVENISRDNFGKRLLKESKSIGRGVSALVTL